MEQPVSSVSHQTLGAALPQTGAPVPPQAGGVVSPQPSFKKAVDKRIILILITVVLFLIASFYLVSQFRSSFIPEKAEEGLLFGEADQKKLVGVFHQNGVAYFGELVFEDEKTILLRDVYQPAGFSPDKQGNLVFRVFRKNEGTPVVDRDYQIPKEEILFVSEKVSSKVGEAIRNYKPSTPAPRPISTPSPAPQPAEEPVLLPSPTTSSLSTPGSGFRI